MAAAIRATWHRGIVKTTPEVVADFSSKDFDYGVADCCQFAGEMVRSVTGANPMDRFTYETEGEAQNIIKRHGSLNAAMREVLGKPICAPYKTGDVVVYQMTNGEQIAGVIFKGRAVVKTKKSLTDWPLDFALNVYRPEGVN